jgi:hypothetical protein
MFGIQVHNEFVQAPSNLEAAYRSLPACPWVNPQTVDDIPIFRGLTKVATNKPVYFTNRSRRLKTLATFPGDCWIEERGTPTTVRGKSAAFAAAGAIGKGRALVLSDHSVFINEMMIQLDNNNFDFAVECVRWLMKRGEGLERARKRPLLDEGEAAANFNVPIEIIDVKMPPLDVESLLGN